MKRHLELIVLLAALLAACAPVDLNAPVLDHETGIDPDAWVPVPAGEFFFGQHEAVQSTDAYSIMVTDVTVDQYVEFLNEALAAGAVRVSEFKEQRAIVGHYPGDEFRGVKHEEEIAPGDWIFVPLEESASRFTFDGTAFAARPGFEQHPMTNVSWFGAWGYCGYHEWRLPSEMEWEKAARGTDTRPFPWGSEIELNNANFYSSRDPFEDMRSYGSRTSPVGFYNGKTYDGYLTRDSASPYGLYDMAGNVWQWTADVYEGMHYRFLRGGSKDTYDMDLRVWARNNATPTYFSPGVGFRCAALKRRAMKRGLLVNGGGCHTTLAGRIRSRLALYWPLLKSVQTGLLLATGLAGYMSASCPVTHWQTLLGLSGSLSLAISGSTILNMWHDRDIDSRMKRTHARPLASGRLDPREALRLGLVLSIAGVAWAVAIEPRYGIVVAAGLFFDVVIYTIWLKRRTAWSIVWGGISGGMPILAGRVLGTGGLDWVGVALACSVLFWIPTHIMTFNMKYHDQYLAAGVPTFPSTYGFAFSRVAVAISSAVAVLVTGIATYGIGMTWGYLRVLAVLSAALLTLAVMSVARPSERLNFGLFKYASVYMLSSMALIVVHGL